MRLEYIRSFIGVVNYKSFSLAAKYLYLSQPTISTHIKQLEAELGVQLLVRSTKDVLLSDEGKIFYPYALQLLETENQALKQLNRCEEQASGIVKLAVSSVPGYYMLPQFIAYFKTRNANVHFNVSEGDSGSVLQKLLNFDVEIGIGGLSSGSDKICAKVLFEDEIVLITPNIPKYKKLNGQFPVEQLKYERFITRELGSGTKIAVEHIEQELKLNPQEIDILAQFESSEMVRRAVEAGSGIAFISKTAARESIEKQKVLEFTFPETNSKRCFYLMYHKERILSPLASSTIQGLREFCTGRNK